MTLLHPAVYPGLYPVLFIPSAALFTRPALHYSAAVYMDRMERNENIANTFMENEEVRKIILDWMKTRVYEELQKSAG